MGNLATPEALIARWDELCRDPSLRDLPYKIELNARSKIELSSRTNAGIRVPDVVWVSSQLMAAYVNATLFQRAPEICAEVCSPDGDEKISAYLAAGAKEVWLVSEAGSIRYFDHTGEKPKSNFPVVITLPPPMKGNP